MATEYGEPTEKYHLCKQVLKEHMESNGLEAQLVIDTFVNTHKLHKCNVLIIGFNLGRYWAVDPHGTLYVPGELLQEHNTIHVLELHNTENVCKVSFDDKRSMDTIDREEFFKTHENSGKYLQNN